MAARDAFRMKERNRNAIVRRALTGWTLAIIAATSSFAQSPCGEWEANAFSVPGVSGGAVRALATFDDGSGPALYAAGTFQVAGSTFASLIARWDGERWSSLSLGDAVADPGDTPAIDALTVYDDGSGLALYAGGRFTSIGGVAARGVARFDGRSWSPVGTGSPYGVTAFGTFDDGSGTALYAAWDTYPIPAQSSRLVKWDGRAWTPIAGQTGPVDATIYCLTTFDDGTGPALYVGGEYRSIGGLSARSISRWDGSQWSALIFGMRGPVYAMCVFDDGSGPALYAGGAFSQTSGIPVHSLARWTRYGWSALPQQLDGGIIRDLFVHDDGTGPALYATGVYLRRRDGSYDQGVARWDGTSWTPMGPALGSEDVRIEYAAATFFDNGSGSDLYMAGSFETVDGHAAASIARRRAGEWVSLATGIYGVTSLASFDDGHGLALYASGTFEGVGSESANHVARWNGSAWSALAGGLGIGQPGNCTQVTASLRVLDDGRGPALFAMGTFPVADGLDAGGIAKWNGQQWSTLGRGLSLSHCEHVSSIESFDDGSGPAIFAGGNFCTDFAHPIGCGIARWDGTAWLPMAPHPLDVRSLATFDDGTGPALYVGGALVARRHRIQRGIARWNGSHWSEVGGGITANPNHTALVNALAVFDDGSGAALYVGGEFDFAGGAPIANIARWNGTTWSSVGGGINAGVETLAVADDGSGPALYASGTWFDQAGGATAVRIARWNGTAWSRRGSGIPRVASSIVGFDDGSGPALFVAGPTEAGGVFSSPIAKWSLTTPLRARRGNVNKRLGEITDTLFVNSSAGDSNRELAVAVGQPLRIHLDAAPAGPASAGYAMWMWSGGSTHPTELVRNRAQIGCLVNPTPNDFLLRPQPIRCMRSPNESAAACFGIHERVGPSAAPWTIGASTLTAQPRTFTIQGLIDDRGAANPRHVSVTNAVVVRIR
ncbi:MAG: hypothetical protein HY292_27465 [Planctomycetes bacterium]|nr:hypothetical protein [Planctomycetota bacterium]